MDWDEIADLIADAYRTVSPKRLFAQLDSITTDEPPPGLARRTQP